MREAFFERQGDVLMGRPHAASMWAPGMLGGRQLSGLVAARCGSEAHRADGGEI